MVHHEQDNTQETIAQQFTNYVTSHANPQGLKEPTPLPESYWRVDISLPLLRDAIEEVSFIVREHESQSRSGYSSTDNFIYDVGIHTRSGLTAYFTFEPQDADTPYSYIGIESQGAEAIEEHDIAKLLSELSAYEASGQMVKIERQTDSPS